MFTLQLRNETLVLKYHSSGNSLVDPQWYLQQCLGFWPQPACHLIFILQTFEMLERLRFRLVFSLLLTTFGLSLPIRHLSICAVCYFVARFHHLSYPSPEDSWTSSIEIGEIELWNSLPFWLTSQLVVHLISELNPCMPITMGGEATLVAVGD